MQYEKMFKYVVCILFYAMYSGYGHSAYVQFKSKTSRYVHYYIVKSDVETLNGKTRSQLQALSVNGTKHSLRPKEQIITQIPQDTFKIAVARLGKTKFSKKNLDHEFLLCGPISNFDEVIISTKKSLGIDKGTDCTIKHNAINEKMIAEEKKREKQEHKKHMHAQEEKAHKKKQEREREQMYRRQEKARAEETRDMRASREYYNRKGLGGGY